MKLGVVSHGGCDWTVETCSSTPGRWTFRRWAARYIVEEIEMVFRITIFIEFVSEKSREEIE